MHVKKMIAPIVITVLMLLILGSQVGVYLWLEEPDISWLVIVLGVGIPLLCAGVSISVLIERIKEIRSGEEDDLSQY
ncbi:MAG: hypothetical protein FWG14_06990 [Peptococcaceae bacterium]|nr:hypothetical protein [Peptococcaceae bacterium]